jgi:polar amino acid transport system permease protein
MSNKKGNMDKAIKVRRSPFRWLRKKVFLFRAPWFDIIQYILLVAGFTWLLAESSERLGYYWQWYRMPRYIFTFDEGNFVIGQLMEGLIFTFKITGISLLFALILGLGTALIRLSNSFMGNVISRVYLELIRNTPLVVQIYLVYFVIGPIIGLDRFYSAVLALSLYEGAYISEIFRAGIVSLHKGQWEASYSLGLGSFDTYRDIILPQSIRRILPPMTGQVITLFKDSALVSIVSLNDLALAARIVAADTFLVFEVWFTTAAIYLVFTIALSTLAYHLENRYRILT